MCALVRNDMLKTDMRLRVQGHGARVLLGKVLANADRLQVTACHCEERSDAAIRISAEILGKQVLLRANSWRFSYSPKVVLFVLRCRKGNGLPRRGAAAPLLAMTSINLTGLRTGSHGRNVPRFC